MKKSTKGQLFLGLDCGMMQFFTYEPQTKDQLMSSRIYGVRFGEKDRGLIKCKP
jgi:hypothetical protein